MKKLINRFVLIFLALYLTGCTKEFCIDADDFGFATVSVPAGYNASAVKGSAHRQYVDWVDTGLVLSGDTVHMTVKTWDFKKNVNNQDELSAWCAWLGPSDSPPSLTEICLFLDDCFFGSDGMCRDADTADILNPPCLFRRGIGLYYLLAPAGFDPNASESISRNPASVNDKVVLGHLGETQRDEQGNPIPFYDYQIDATDNNPYITSPASTLVRTNGLLKKLSTQEQINLKGGKLYFKILDNYYENNSGQYVVKVKSGVQNTNWAPIDYVVGLIRDFFFDDSKGIIKIIFNDIVSNPSFKSTVRSLITLSVMFYAFNFLIGNVNMTQIELLTRVLKIIIVSQLLTGESSWYFFHEYLLKFFLKGSWYLIKMIDEAAGAGPGSSNILQLMISEKTIYKLFALPMVSMTSFGFGIFFIIIYFIALVLLFVAYIYAGVAYIVALTMMGFLIGLMPLFLCFLLFDSTQNLFDNWLKQLGSFALQALILATGIAFIKANVQHQIYTTLGFRICKFEYFNKAFLGQTQNAIISGEMGTSSRAIQPYVFLPRYSVHEEPTKMLIPESHFEGQNFGYFSSSREEATGRFCGPYECVGERYPSFPFLDPNDDPDNTDKEILDKFRNRQFYHFKPVLYILVTSMMLSLFIKRSLSIGTFLTGGQTDTSEASMKTGTTVTKATMNVAKTGIKVGALALNVAFKALNFVAGAVGGVMRGIGAAVNMIGKVASKIASVTTGIVKFAAKTVEIPLKIASKSLSMVGKALQKSRKAMRAVRTQYSKSKKLYQRVTNSKAFKMASYPFKKIKDWYKKGE